MLGSSYPAQQLGVPLVACTHVAHALAFLQQRLQVIEHQQDTGGAQGLQQEAQATFEAHRHVAKRLGDKHLETLTQQFFEGGSLTQGAPDDDLEVLRHSVHHPDRQRRFADAPQSQHAHHPAALLDDPGGQQVLFPFTPIEGRDNERVSPIHARSTLRRSKSLGSARSLRVWL